MCPLRDLQVEGILFLSLLNINKVVVALSILVLQKKIVDIVPVSHEGMVYSVFPQN